MGRKTPKRHFKIYALLDRHQKIAFIGKSYAKDLSSIFSNHICGKNVYTKAYFGKTPPLVIPELCILSEVYDIYKVAYKWILAWVRVFLENGYTMVMQEGSVMYATALHPDTKKIYDSLLHEPLDDVLKRGTSYSEKTAYVENASKNQKEEHRELMHFNLSVFKDDLESFSNFCADRGLSKKDGFSLLVKGCPKINDKDSFAAEELAFLQKKLIAQTATLEDVQGKLEKAMADLRDDARYSILLETVQDLLREYCKVACTFDAEPFEKLKIVSFNSFLNFSHYDYPSEEVGCCVVALKALVYGRGVAPPIWILVEDEEGKLLKFRTYPDKSYLGIRIPRSALAFRGARWLVSWRRAIDGAIELCGSLPISPALDKLVPDDYLPPMIPDELYPLDEIIYRASEKRGLW